MSKTLLIGPAGCGKTRLLLDEFEKSLTQNGDPLAEDFFFVLPSAEHTERIVTLIVQRQIPGFFHRRVTTLSRLIGQIFKFDDENVASSITRYLMLSRLFENRSWPYFEAVQKSGGFLNLTLGFLDELKESLIPVHVFRNGMNRLKQVEPDFSAKYEALAEIYEAYESEFKRQGLRVRQDDLWIYREMKRQGKFEPVRFKKIWIDGFFDFSNLQLEYIRELTGLCDEMTVTLTRDRNPLRQSLFENVIQTETRLKAMGFEARFLKEGNFRSRSKTLAALERGIFLTEKAETKPSASGEITIFETVGMEGEIEMIAREILMLYRKGDFRLSDFAILLRQIAGYGERIRAVFSRHGIPVEIHEREKLQFAPLFKAVIHFLKIFRDGWRRTDVLAFLKSSYVKGWGKAEGNAGRVHELEHWALRTGILQGRERWFETAAVSKDPEHHKAFVEWKKNTLTLLTELEGALRQAPDAAQIKKILLQSFYHDFGILAIEDSFEDYVRRDAASLCRLEALLEELEAHFTPGSGKPLDYDTFTDHFLRLVELDLYSLHHRDKNQVQVYDVSLARQKEYRVVFVAGLLERSFPIQIREDPLLSDWERQLFNAGQAENPLRERLPSQNMERYLFYLAVTRASERLYLTYPRIDLEGKESLPSYYLEEVKAVFRGPLVRKSQDLTRPLPEWDELVNESELEMAVAAKLWARTHEGPEEPLLIYLTNHVLSRETGRAKLLRTFHEIPTELTDPKIKENDLFESRKTSPTKVEEYAKCPFLYYANRILKLRDPEEEINIKLKGILLHEVLEKFFRAWSEHPSDFEEQSKILACMKKLFDEALESIPLVYEKGYRRDLELANLLEGLERFLERELKRLEKSPLKPRYLELGFGRVPGEGKAFPAFEVEDQGSVISLSGKIDRIDVDAAHHLGVVMDYKSSAAFKKKGLELGYALQLPIYLKVMERYLKLEAVGAEIYSIHDCRKQGFYQEANATALHYASGRQFLLEPKAFNALMDQSFRFLGRFTRGMADLKIPAKPRDIDFCRSFCSLAPVCRIEKWRLPLILEEIRKDDEADEKSRRSS